MNEICGFCGRRENLQRCARCHVVLYCSKEHQRAHWKVHRKGCVPKCDVGKGPVTPTTTVSSSSPSATAGQSAPTLVGATSLDPEFYKSTSLSETPQSEVAVSQQNGTASPVAPVTGSKAGRRNVKKNKVSVRMNGNNNNMNNLHNNNNISVPGSKKIHDNLENHAPYSDGHVNIMSGPSPPTPSPPPSSASNSSSAVGMLNKSTPVSLSPLISTSPAVNASTSGTLQSNNRISAPFFHRNLQPHAAQFSSMWVLHICQQVIHDMDKYGVCVVDNLLGDERGGLVFKEVQSLYTTGAFKDGQVVKEQKENKTGVSQTIRGDKITWVDGKEPHCENIAFLISLIDSIVMGANKLKNNGKLGSYTIRERTKAMIACYPGSGTHYVKHVDNPNQDGRCITSIYYLNKDWNTKENGGLLRIFPEGWTNQVADIEPLFDRVLFFWSDRRNPHEVQPAYRTRYAITLWYFDAEEREKARGRDQSRSDQLQELS